MKRPQSAATPHLQIIEPPGRWLSLRWGELWDQRGLLLLLAERHIRVRYKQTVLGVLWAVLQPLIATLLFTVLFGNLLGVQRHLAMPGVPYAVFVLSGLLPWMLFASTVSGAAASLVGEAQLMTRVYFPRAVIPLSVMGYTLLDFLVAAGVLAAMMLVMGVAPSPLAWLTPLVVLMILAAAAGCGLVLAGLTVKYRDLRFVLPFVMQLWMFLTPVIYPATVIPAGLRWLTALNPMSGLIQLMQRLLLGAPCAWGDVLISLVTATLMFLLGFVVFWQIEDSFADIV